MKKFVVTTALALVLTGGAYAQDHHGRGAGGGGGGFGGGGGGGPSMMSHGPSGGAGPSMMSRGPSGGGPSMMSRGPSGPSTFSDSGRMRNSNYNEMRGSQFSRTNQGPQGRTVYNQDRGNRTLYNKYNDRDHGKYGKDFDRDHGKYGKDFDRDHGKYGKDFDRDHGKYGRDHDHDQDFRHRGIVRGDFFEHGRHFHFRRFWHGEWVFLADWDDCTAWAWVHVAPGVWAWRPVDICIG